MIINNIEFYGLNYQGQDMSDKFLISKEGEIYSINSDKLLKLQTHKKGHKQVNVSYKGKGITIRVHTAMGYTFMNLGQYNVDYSIRHKDNDKTNNKLENLEIVTNTKIAKEAGGSNRRLIRCNQTKEEFKSITEVDRMLGIRDKGRTVRKHLNGELPHIKGYTFTEI